MQQVLPSGAKADGHKPSRTWPDHRPGLAIAQGSTSGQKLAGNDRTTSPPAKPLAEVPATKRRQRMKIAPAKTRPVGIMKAQLGEGSINPLSENPHTTAPVVV